MSELRRIGAFEILEKIGAGGMGEVFKARDTRLNRFVAIKLLPDTAGAAAAGRFQREALAIAALNHPNICTLHEAGEDHGQPYLVMELLEGETLYARLQRGPVAMPQLAEWGSEIADALQAAHAKGILHRDLKPGNIFITERGTIKVLDFGLAQFALAAAADADAPTMAASTLAAAGPGPLTLPGTTLGTYAYMSPEQARGEAAGARSDIFSLGTVLYEMAGGQAPFRGRTTADLTAAILMLAPPPPSSLRPDVPPRFDDIVAQCLEKDPALRYQSAADLRVSLRRLLAPSSSSGAASSGAALPAATPAPKTRRPWLWPAIAAVIIAAGALSWWGLHAPAALPAPPQLQFHPLTYSGQVEDAVISPDGKFLAHVDASPLGFSLRLLSIASSSDIQIVAPAPDCCRSPSFSPDGSQVYFLQHGVLKAVPVLGGTVNTIAHGACSGAGFSPDGSAIAYLTTIAQPPRSALMIARPDGLAAHQLNLSAPGTNYDGQCWGAFGKPPTHAPAWSPDGRWLALESSSREGGHHIGLVDSRNGSVRTLGPLVRVTGTDFNWVPDGSGLVFTASIPDSATSQVWEVTYPGGRLLQLTDDLQGYGNASLSNQAQLVLIHGTATASLWVQAQAGGAFLQLPGGGSDLDGTGGLAWTPQDQLISTRTFGNRMQLWTEDAGGSNARALSMAGGPDRVAGLSVAPSGQIVFAGFESGTNGFGIWRANADGSGLTEIVRAPAGQEVTSPTLALGEHDVVYLLVDANDNENLWIVPLAGGAPRQLSPIYVAGGGNPASPDGSSLFAFQLPSGSGNPAKPFVMQLGTTPPQIKPLPAMNLEVADRPNGWTADGRAITYIQRLGSTDNIWAVPLAGGKPYALTHFNDLHIAAYAFSHDGRLAISRGAPNSDAVEATGLSPNAAPRH